MLDRPKTMSRWARPRSPVPLGNITPDDLKILSYFAKYPFLDTRDIAMLLNRTSIEATNVRLREICYAHLIKKPHEQRQFVNSLSRSLVFELDKAGVQLLQDHGLSVEPAFSAPRHWFAHSFMICQVVASIEAGASRQGIVLIPRPKTRFNLPNGKHLYPDAVFTLHYPDGKQLHFALECDRRKERVSEGAVDQTAYETKLNNYRTVITTASYKDAGLGHLNILHVTTHKPRKESIKATCGASKSNMFKVHPSIGQHTFEDNGKLVLIHAPSNGSMFGSWERVGHPDFEM